jgi:hypothetical protein
MLRHIFIIIFLAIILTSCSKNSKKNPDFKLSSFIEKINIKNGSFLFDDKIELMDPRKLRYHPDSFLVIQELGTNKMIKIIDLKTGNIQKILKKGKGPKEVISAWGVYIIGRNIWVFGSKQKKLIKISPADNRKFEISNEFILDDKYVFGGTMNSDTSYIALSFGDSTRLSFFNNNGELTKKMGGFPSFINDKTISPNNDIFDSTVAASKNGKKIVLACYDTDIIEIYDIKKGLQHRLQGPYGHSFSINKKTIEGNFTMFLHEPMFYAYGNAIGRDEGFYIGYRGLVNPTRRKLESSNEGYPNKIFYFNWDGQPLKLFEFEQHLIAFDLNTEENKMYCIIRTPEPKIKVFNLLNKKQ